MDNRNIVRIALSGIDGTEKNDLGKKIAQSLDIAFLQSNVRHIGSNLMGIKNSDSDIPNDKLLAQQFAFLFEQLSRESILSSLGFSYVVERSSLDYIAYFTQKKLHDSHYIKLARKWAEQNYTHLVYCSAGPILPTSPKLHKTISEDHMILDAIIRTELGVYDHVLETSGTTEEKLQTFLNHFVGNHFIKRSLEQYRIL